ncbi:MAG: RNA polymerase sigma-70 factor [Tannerella sp.]|jgi:RNA polymerase sigma-70 factor (ECF subfamily)|nr:RNA polymerase sigma-70 factor [Tannerella sp.]
MQTQVISVEKIKAGDTGEFERLFRSYYKQLCAYSSMIIKNDQEAEDIVSSMFAKLWEKHGELDIKTSVESYMYSAVHRQSLNYLKHIQVEEQYWEEAQYQMKNDDLLSGEDSNNPLSDIIAKETNENIERAMNKLPPQCRQVFVLNKLEGLSYNEIAEELNISINTVRTQLTRGIHKMKKSLSKYLLLLLCFLLF